MEDFVFDYLLDHGVQISSQTEQQSLERGITTFLLNNGIREDANGAYYEHYLRKRLRIIDDRDLKLFFVFYSLINEVNQIVIEYKSEGQLPQTRKKDLCGVLADLHNCGLGEKYVPVDEIKQILG